MFECSRILLLFIYVMDTSMAGCVAEAGETNMMFGHWFPPHIASLAGYNNYIVNFRHSYAVVLV